MLDCTVFNSEMLEYADKMFWRVVIVGFLIMIAWRQRHADKTEEA